MAVSEAPNRRQDVAHRSVSYTAASLFLSIVTVPSNEKEISQLNALIAVPPPANCTLLSRKGFRQRE